MTDPARGSSALERRLATAIARPMEPEVRGFAERLGRANDALAVLFYGSNLRTGSLDGVLDFYVLTQGPQKEKIWPRVSYHEWTPGKTTLRAKVATMALETFSDAAAGKLVDTTIWARFVQPCGLAWQRDDRAAAPVVEALAQAARTAARLAVALGPDAGTPDDYWRALFRATYAAELRVEKAGREDSILSVNRDHFDGLLPLALDAEGIAFTQGQGGTIHPDMARAERTRIVHWWDRRRRLGKPYNVMRLLKASTTFEGAARYAAWKVERHTGIAVKLTPWRERHPVLSAPAVLWQVWRAKKARAMSKARP